MMRPFRRLVVSAFALLLAAPAAAQIRVTGQILPPSRDKTVAFDKVQVDLVSLNPAYREAVRRLRGEPETPLATARPRPDGSFEISAPAAGLYRVVVRAAGSLPLQYTLAPLVEETELPPLELRSATPVEIRIVGPDGAAVAGVPVSWLSRWTGLTWTDARVQWMPAEVDAVSGPDGRVAALLIPDGRLEILTSPSGFAWTRTETRESKTTVRLSPSRQIVDLELRDARGNRVPGALVQQVRPVEGLTRPVGLTDAEGRWKLPLSPEVGEMLLVEAEDGRMVQARVPVQATAGRPWIVELPAPKTAAAAGRVLDEDGRAPLPGALVWSERPFFRGALAGTDGGFQLQLPALHGHEYLSAAAPGHLRGTHPVSRPAGGSGIEPVNFLLRPAASVSGLVVDAAGRPVAGAQVQVETRRDGRGDYVDREAWSGADGRFRLRPLSMDETYRLTTLRAGFVPARTLVTTGPAGSPAATARIVLSPGRSAYGQVVDETGQPVAGAEVLLVPTLEEGPFITMSLPPGILRTSTDAQGAFELAHVPPGRFDLAAGHPRFAPVSRPGLAEDEPGRLDLGLLTLHPGAVLEGRVSDKRGAPIAGAEIRYMPFQYGVPLQVSWFDRLRVNRATSGADGTFRIEGLSPGSGVRLSVKRQGFKERMLESGVPAPEPLRVEMQAVRGLAGRVVGPRGEPVSDANVLYSVRSEDGLSVGASAVTDGDGRFRLADVLPGPVRLQVETRGYRLQVWDGELPETGEARPVEIALERGETLEGRVLDGDGNPVPGAAVTADLEEVYPAQRQSLIPFGTSTQTDGDGRYVLEGLDASLYAVRANHGGRRASAMVEIEPGVNQLDLTFERETGSVEVSGQVRDDRGAPAAGVKLMLIPREGRTLQEVSAEDGTFRFASVPAGNVQLQGTLDGFVPIVERLTVGDSPVRGLDLRLARGGAITGRLLGVKPEELAGVRISASGMNRSTAGVQPDREGRYRLSGITPGDWLVTVMLSPQRLKRGKVRLESGAAEAVLDFDLTADLVLSGRLTIDGAPLGTAEIGLESLDDRDTAAGTMTTPGSPFRIGGLPPGNYRLTVTVYSPRLRFQRQVQLSSDLDITGDLSTATVQGRVLSPTGEPAAGSVVLAGNAGEWSAEYHLGTDDQGRLRPQRVLAGTYEVRVHGMDGSESRSTLQVAPGSVTELEAVLGNPPS